ncbi:MAG TPA: TatD family hydrolase [Candidatus Binataceae bacterium]|nr:TatD family hydrolase [Candidatus Binataceae bacterium]
MDPIVDAHCHLADPRLYPDLDGALARAAAAAVRTIVAVGAIETIETDRLTVEIAERHPRVFAAVGVHPHNAADCDEARIAALAGLARSPKVVAIGETGLDFHYMHSPPDAQERALRRHLELARALDRPVMIHCRNAERRLCEIVRETGLPPAGGMIHCFTGDAGAARDFVELGFYVSFSGILTFKKADELRAAAKVVPEDRLLIETDAPYLAPEPYRGKPNEPAYVRRTFEAMAALRGADPSALAARICANAARLFRLPAA